MRQQGAAIFFVATGWVGCGHGLTTVVPFPNCFTMKVVSTWHVMPVQYINFNMFLMLQIYPTQAPYHCTLKFTVDYNHTCRISINTITFYQHSASNPVIHSLTKFVCD